ncbi:hypothetical protein [Pseudomonas extremaustralis]
MKIEEKIKLVSGLSDDELFVVVEANLQALVTLYIGNSVYFKNSPVLVFIEARLEEIHENKDSWIKVHDINEIIVSYVSRLKSQLPELQKKHNASMGRKRKSSGSNDKEKIIDKHESLRGV